MMHDGMALLWLLAIVVLMLGASLPVLIPRSSGPSQGVRFVQWWASAPRTRSPQ